MRCEIDCRLTAGHQAVQEGELPRAIALAREIVDLLDRAIRCGAVLDPWNLLGFDAQFSLFPALENSVHDHRADELVTLMELIFAYFSRIWSAAAAEDKQDLCQQIRQQFQETANWWRQFAAHEVSSVDAVDADEIFRAAEHVAESLNLWHKGGAAAGDVRFWAPYAHLFDSPKSFSLVIEALLERQDFRGHHVAADPLAECGGYRAAGAGRQLVSSSGAAVAAQSAARRSMRRMRLHACRNRRRQLVRQVLRLSRSQRGRVLGCARLLRCGRPSRTTAKTRRAMRTTTVTKTMRRKTGDEADLFGAAYEDLVFIDSTDDGVEGELFDTRRDHDGRVVARVAADLAIAWRSSRRSRDSGDWRRLAMDSGTIRPGRTNPGL